MTNHSDRQAWMSELAKANPATLNQLWSKYGEAPAFKWLRTPETGAVMVRGLAGAKGALFNMGEMTVTRCSLRLESGEVGHAYVQGRDARKAEQAALVDALMQTMAASDVRDAVIKPLRAARDATATARAEKAASTKVEFFTMARGED